MAHLTGYQIQMVTLLKISPCLVTRPGAVELRLAYSKYKGFLEAHSEQQHMTNENTWPIKVPVMIELIGCFVSKSVWHAKYTEYFPKVKNYPELEEWLCNGPGAPAGIDIFGYDKTVYGFSDLRDVLVRLEKVDKKAKAKGKKRARDDGDGDKRERKKLKASGSKPSTS
jgi:hypothetical protein